MPIAQVWPSNPRLACTGGELAQLVERCDRTAEVRGSNPLFSIDHFSNRGVLNTGLGTLVTLSVLARPDALVTFTILILAIGWGRWSPCPDSRVLPWGKREQ